MNKRLLVRVLSLVIIFTMTALMFGGIAQALIQGGAYYYGKTRVNSSGVSTCANIKYYIDTTNMPSSVISYYSGTITDALQSWVNKTKSNSSSKARVTISRVYSEANATFVFRLKAISARGDTVHYFNSNQVSPFSQNWNKCIVYLKNTLWSYGYSQAKRTICHEIGHCLGLAHPASSEYVHESVMWTHDSSVPESYKVISPSTSDNTNIKQIYK